MKLSLAESKYLKDSIGVISELVSEARFNISKDGITLIAMDPANVAMVVFKLLPSLFTEYKVTDNVEIALNLNNLKQILRRVGQSDTLTLEMQDSSKLKVIIGGKSIRKFALPIIALDEREQRTPNLSFATTITMPVEMLTDAVEDASVVADSLLINCDGKKITVSAAGDLNNVEIEIPSTDEAVEIISDDIVKSRYSVEYLKKMCASSKLSDTVKLQFGKDYPLKLEYATIDKVSLAFILAPRVEHE